MEEEKKEKGFIIKDKRIFDETGAARKQEEKEASAASEKKEEKPPEASRERVEAEQREEVFPEVTFSNFIFSLSTTAMFHFGDFPDPVTKKSGKNLAAAKHTIDTLDMIKNKTRGNLDQDEQRLLEGIIYELKMRYVKEKST